MAAETTLQEKSSHRLAPGMALFSKLARLKPLKYGPLRDRGAQQLSKMGQRLGMDRAEGYELADIAVSALGPSFFQEPTMKPHRITGVAAAEHSLLRSMDTQDAPEIFTAELLELGLYLRTFSLDPEIGELLVRLRVAAEYEAAFFQLAMGYRFSVVGEATSLEPETDRGKADIQFSFGKRVYIAECYRIRFRFFEQVGEFESALGTELMSLVPEGEKYRFHVRIEEPLTFAGMRRVLKSSRELVGRFSSNRISASSEMTSVGCRVRIEDITDVEPDPDFDGISPAKPLREDHGPDLIIARRLARVRHVFEVPDDAGTGGRYSRVLVWRGYTHNVRDVFQTVEKKIGNKLRQTKVAGQGYGRVALVQFPMRVGEGGWRLDRLQEDNVRRYPEVSAIFLLNRQIVAGRHFGYAGPVLLGRPEVAVPDELLERMRDLEVKGLFRFRMSQAAPQGAAN